MNDEQLRLEVKIAKAKGQIKNLYSLATYLDMSEKGFYNWLSGYVNLGYGKKQKLIKFIKGENKNVV